MPVPQRRTIILSQHYFPSPRDRKCNLRKIKSLFSVPDAKNYMLL